MPSRPVQVKWNKRLLTVDALPASSDDLKALLFSMTSVPADRQTLMCKQAWKGVLADGVDLAALDIPADALVVLMGTPVGSVPEQPKDKVVFLEDLSSSAQAATGKVLPPGLSNLDNTCYLNATLQVLRAAPELAKAVASGAAAGPPGDSARVLAKELAHLFGEMGKYVDKVTPMRFVAAVRQVFPRFNEQVRGCWGWG
jgi:ubiquitin carboxyl-terminal hydrolase 14